MPKKIVFLSLIICFLIIGYMMVIKEKNYEYVWVYEITDIASDDHLNDIMQEENYEKKGWKLIETNKKCLIGGGLFCISYAKYYKNKKD